MECIIPGFPEYKINSNGEVFSLYKYKTNIVTDIWRPVKWVLDSGVGYYLVTMVNAKTKRRSNQFIHRLLGQSFIPNPHNKAHVNHIDGVKTNNSLCNLEWTTPRENCEHAIRMGLRNTEASCVVVIQCDRNTLHEIAIFKSAREAAKVTGVAYQNISKVVTGVRPTAGGFSWKYLEQK